MASQHAPTSLLLFLLAGLFSSAAAFNITRLLGEYSDFSHFNDLLTQTKLADEINRRQTITVLALDNGAAGSISSLSPDVQRKVLAMHVVLDYYDTAKLEAIKGKSTTFTTLFQSSGQATDRMGFLNFTKRASEGEMVFGSAEPGAPIESRIVKSVASRPYNVSVLQVSTAIVPPGVGGKVAAPPPRGSAAKAPAPAPAKGTKAEPPSDDDSDEEASAPGPSDDEASADGPSADGPGPVADGPIADGPMADGPGADAPGSEKSSDDAADAPEGSAAAGRAVAGGGGLCILALLLII